MADEEWVESTEGDLDPDLTEEAGYAGWDPPDRSGWVLAQRLVRRLCEGCREEVEQDPQKVALVRRLYRQDDLGDELIFFRGRGCEACQYTGFLGRLPVAEFLDVDEELRGLILEKARTSEILRMLLERGWRTLLDDGLKKASQGLTTFEEVLRSISLREVM